MHPNFPLVLLSPENNVVSSNIFHSILDATVPSPSNLQVLSILELYNTGWIGLAIWKSQILNQLVCPSSTFQDVAIFFCHVLPISWV